MAVSVRVLPAVVVPGLVILGLAPAALADAWRADAWRATAALAPDAPMACRQADVSKMFFDFTQTADALLVKTTDGQTFAAPVAADGSVTTTLTVPVGAKSFAVNVTGNARTRELQAFNTQYACRFRLTPLP